MTVQLSAELERESGATDGGPVGTARTEELLAEHLAVVLDLADVGSDQDLFDDLGADSMLIAEFCSRLRKVPDLPGVSIKDVYQHPSVAGLAAHLDRASLAEAAEPAAADGLDDGEWGAIVDERPVTTFGYWLCGVLQLGTLLALTLVSAVVVEISFDLIAPAAGPWDTYWRSVGVGAGVFAVLALVPIAAKWLIIGRWKPRRIRLWSLGYYRFWLGRLAVRSNPLVLFAGTPIYPIYLRALGAKVGRGAVVLSRRVPVCTDLITIGSGAVLREDVFVSGYRAVGGHLELGPVEIGDDAFVGNGTVLDIGSTVGASAQVAHSSSVAAGQSIPDGARVEGTPATSAIDFDFVDVAPSSRPVSRRVAYSALQVLLLFFVTAPLFSALSIWFLEWRSSSPPSGATVSLFAVDLAPWRVLAIAAIVFGVLLALRAFLAFGVARVLSRALRADRAYPLFGIRYLAHRGVQRLTNQPFFGRYVGDSSYVLHYLRALGYRLTFEDQTGANFGQTVRHDNPHLVEVGTGTMAADGLALLNTDYSNTSFRLSTVRIPSRSFFGNEVLFPSQAAVGDNCLLASKLTVPIGEHRREDTGFLGSPSFEIPRLVFRDRGFEERRHSPDFPHVLRAKNRHNLRSMGWLLLFQFVALIGGVAVAFGIADVFPTYGFVSVLVGLVGLSVVALPYYLAAEWASIRFRRMQPEHLSIYDLNSWRVERFWKLSFQPRLLAATPFRGLLWRLYGVRVGRRLFDDGAAITEKTMVTIGDDCALNTTALIQPHSQEDGSFKSERISIGSGCTVGVRSLVHYGATLGDRTVVEANSFVMKGTVTPESTVWGENPARELGPVRTHTASVPALASSNGDRPNIEETEPAAGPPDDGATPAAPSTTAAFTTASTATTDIHHVPVNVTNTEPEEHEAMATHELTTNGTNATNGTKDTATASPAPETDHLAADAYWRDALMAGGLTPIPRWTFDGTDEEATTVIALPSGLAARLDDVAQRLGTTIDVVLLAAQARVVATLTGETDAVVGYVPVDSASALPCRLALADTTWDELVQDADAVAREVTTHRHIDLDALRAELNLGGPPFELAVDASGALDGLPPRAAVGISLLRGTIGARLRLRFLTLDFDEDTATRIGVYHLRALELLCDDPSAPATSGSIVTDDEVEYQVHQLAGPERELPDRRFHELFEDRVDAHPDAVAARHLDVAWTYAQLNEHANLVAQAILAAGVGREDVVAVVTERNLAWMASVIGVFKAGAVYLPIEPHFPAGRIEKTLGRAGCELVVTELGSTETLDDALRSLPSTRTLLLDDIFDAGGDASNPDVEVEFGQLAYMYFTSGSTGEPKGAMCEHAGMINHLYAKVDDFGIREGEVVAQVAPQCFDISLWQLISAMLVGGSTVLVDQDTIMQPERFVDLIVDAEVGVMQVVPSYLEVLLTYLDQHPRELPELHCVSVTGEALTLELAHRWFRTFDGIKLANAYGLTETSDDTNHEVMTEAPIGTVPLGPAVNNAYVYVIDEELRPVPLGSPGEIAFSGICVGRGYINDPERTAAAYLDDPLRPGERLYRSGDFGRWRPDGKLEYLGRRDAQVKIRGFRIEIGEIENVLAQLEGVRQGAVVVTDREDGNKQLVAFYSGREHTVDSLRQHLGRSLPEYMVPSSFHWRERLPLTDNGKINRKALRAVAEDMEVETAEFEAPRTATELRLAELWADILGVPTGQIGRRDHFFDRGGSSLSAVEMVVALDNAISLKEVTAAPVLADLARIIDGDALVEGGLLQQLASGGPAARATMVCVPYAGGNAVNFQPFAQALGQAGVSVHAVELPGHQLTEADDDFASIDDLARRAAAEIRELGDGPIALWGHSAGTALAIETARRLADDGVRVDAVFVAAQLPGDAAIRRGHLDHLCSTSDRKIVEAMTVATGFGDLAGLDAVQIGHLGAAMRHDVVGAHRYFIERLEAETTDPVYVPLVVVTAADDAVTADAAARAEDWSRFGTPVTHRELDRGGHFFIRTEPQMSAAVVRNVLLGDVDQRDEPAPPQERPRTERRRSQAALARQLEIETPSGGPARITVEGDPDPLAFAARHRDTLRGQLVRHGALLVRGLTIDGPDDFLALAQIVSNGLLHDTEAFAPREQHLGQAYSSSAWPANQQMCMHHELSYRQTFPGTMIFGCLREAESGGAIPLASAAAVLDALPTDLVRRFDEQGWILRRNYTEDIGLSVAEAFGTDDRETIDTYCAENAIEAAWTADGGLRTEQRRRAIVEHPVTGVRCWFNQIAFLNEWTMKPEVREFLVEMYGDDGLPFTTLFGDGEPIGPDVVETINAAYDSVTIREPLRTHDVLLVDNIATAHSREPYEGEREVIVSLGDPWNADVRVPAAKRSRRTAAARSR